MSIVKYLHRRATYFKRLKEKKESINKILNHPNLLNNDVVNIHRTDITNAGDFYCGPHHYFKELKGKSLDIFGYKNKDKSIRDDWSEKIINKSLIIGGGGLLCLSAFNKQMRLFEKLKKKGKKTVIWGAGHNSINRLHFNNLKKYNVNTSSFGLIGVRDYSMKEDWVPCVSCLHPIFDQNIEEDKEIGIILHKNTLTNKKVINTFKGIPSIANNDKFEDIIKFIGRTNTIITSSYHAMYWSILLEKKVLVFPSSSKFFDFKYQPIISNITNYKNDIKKAQSYSGVLEECRNINLKFADKVFDYLGL